MSTIATTDFLVTLRNKQVLNLTFELKHSEAFRYGNKTAVVVNDGRRNPIFLDTRHDKTLRDTGSNFDEWCAKYIQRNYSVTQIRQMH